MIKTADILGKEAATAYLQKQAWAPLIGAAARGLMGLGARAFGQRAGMSVGQRAMGALSSPGAMTASYAPELAQRTKQLSNPRQWESTMKDMMPQGVQARQQLS
jgi:hypothetical protein